MHSMGVSVRGSRQTFSRQAWPTHTSYGAVLKSQWNDELSCLHTPVFPSLPAWLCATRAGSNTSDMLARADPSDNSSSQRTWQPS